MKIWFLQVFGWNSAPEFFFHQLGLVLGLVVAMSVCCCRLLVVSPSNAIFFEASHWPCDHMISLRPLIGQPSPPSSNLYRFHYLHRSRELVSPVCGIFGTNIERKKINPIFKLFRIYKNFCWKHLRLVFEKKKKMVEKAFFMNMKKKN